MAFAASGTPGEAQESHHAQKVTQGCELHALSMSKGLFPPIALSVLKDSHQAAP